jgi:hypothetical protein
MNMDFSLARRSCASMPCSSNQICSEQPTGPVCTCSGSKAGTFCQFGKWKLMMNEWEKSLSCFYLDNPCSPSSCANGGTCVSTNTDPPIPSCLCPSGFTGSDCSRTIQNTPCASNPCQTRGYCALSASNTSYSCICQTNYIGDQCERSKKIISLIVF